ncbi:lipoprotein [Flavobacteriaceae bacterium MHTCC 0001]
MEFVETLGGSLNESGQAVVNTSDNGYAILGFSQSMNGDISGKNNESFDFWLLKFSNTNELQWQKTYGGSGDDRGQSIITTNDGGFAILGYSKSNDGDVSENFGNDDFWVLKLNAVGDIIWETSLGFSGADRGYKIIQTSDNGYLAIGVLDVTASNGQGNSKTTAIKHAGGDYWAVKLNANGEIQWSKFFGGTFTDTPYDVVATNDNSFIIVGSSDSNDVDITSNKGTYDFWVVKISNSGDLIWEQSFGGSQIDEAWGIVKSNDGNFIVTGDTRSNDKDVSKNNGAADIFITKISTNGDLIWQKTIGGTSFDASRSISKTMDGGYVISGSSRSSNGDITKNKGQNDALVVKLDNSGNVQWQKTVGGTNVDIAFDAIELDDGSIIAVGESSSLDQDITENKGFTDLLVFKIK